MSPNREPVKSPIEQLKDVGQHVEASWQVVVECHRQAILELVPDISETEMQMLSESFWPTAVGILERTSQSDPNITEKVMARTEEIHQARMLAETAALKAHMVRQFIKNALGLQRGT